MILINFIKKKKKLVRVLIYLQGVQIQGTDAWVRFLKYSQLSTKSKK